MSTCHQHFLLYLHGDRRFYQKSSQISLPSTLEIVLTVGSILITHCFDETSFQENCRKSSPLIAASGHLRTKLRLAIFSVFRASSNLLILSTLHPRQSLDKARKSRFVANPFFADPQNPDLRRFCASTQIWSREPKSPLTICFKE